MWPKLIQFSWNVKFCRGMYRRGHTPKYCGNVAPKI